MKKTVFVLTMLIALSSFAQNSYPRIEKKEITEKTFHGMIDGKYAITMYLKFNQIMHFDRYYKHYVYSVSGWYYYNNVGTKISIAGFVNGNSMKLYVFNDAKRTNELLNFETSKDDFYAEVEYYENLSGYLEKFELEERYNDNGEEEIIGTWKTSAKSLPVSFDENNLTIKETIYTLAFNPKNFYELGRGEYATYNMVAQKNNNFIIEYSYMSNPSNPMGMCGAGEEKEFLFLKFNNNYEKISEENYLYESCLRMIYSEIEEISPTKTKYTYSVFGNEESFIVDLENVTIEKAK